MSHKLLNTNLILVWIVNVDVVLKPVNADEGRRLMDKLYTNIPLGDEA